MTVTVTTDSGSIRGTVTDAHGRPASTTVILFPEDRDRWTPESPFIRALLTETSESSAAGRFHTSLLLPGRYAAVALDIPRMLYQPDAEMLERIRPFATVFDVAARETTTVTLNLSALK